MPRRPASHVAAVTNLQPRQTAVAAFIDTTIEWYGFYIYGLVAALVFGKVLFSRTLDPGIAALLSFVTLWAGFAARPIGGIIFGYPSDKTGRRTTPIITLILMNVATIGIGLLPNYAQIDLWTPIGLVVLRVVQDMAVGGEQGGAVLTANESVPRRESTLYSASAQQGSPTDNLLATLVFFALSTLPTPQFMLWGWRVPFLLSALLMVVGVVIRLELEESDGMERVLAQGKTVKLPPKDVVRDHWGLVLLDAGTLPLIHVTYLKSNFALTWATKGLSYAQDIFLDIIAIALVVQPITQPLGAWLVSRMGMRRTIYLMVLPEFLLIPVMFFTIEAKMVWVALFSMYLATVPHSVFYGAVSGVLTRVSPTHARYTGLSLACQLCPLMVGGGTPVFARWMFNSSGNIVDVAVSSALYALMSLAHTLVLLNRTGYRADELSTAKRADTMELGQGDADVSWPFADPVGKPVAAV